MNTKILFSKGFIFIILILFIGISITPLTEGMKKEENFKNRGINGLYYLRDDDPLNWADVGSLMMNVSTENESTRCGMFINFHFAQKGVYTGYNRIFNIYYHFWQKVIVPDEFEIGYSTSYNHSAGFNESVWINTNNYISEVNDYRLIQVLQITNPEIAVFKDDDIYNFTIKFFGPNPYVICNPNQYSFIILNLEDNLTLQGYDRDNDLLNDYDELFVYYTNPFDYDTDDDGYSDYEEIYFGSDPNNFYDDLSANNSPNIPIIKGPLRGKADIEYEYIFSSSDPESHNCYYYIDWGDGHIEEWIGQYSSGVEVSINHIWDENGEYTIKAKVKDIFGAESDWGSLEISIANNRLVYRSIFQNFLEQFPLLKRLLFLM